MMKKAIGIIVAVLFTLTIVSLSFAVGEKTVDADKPKVKQFTGEVKAVDEVAKTVTLIKKRKDKVEETVLTINDKTKITMGKEKKVPADVKVGDYVTAKYKEVDGQKVAKSIAIKVEKKGEIEKKEK